MALKTQGSELYFADPDTGAVVEVGCVTTFTGLSAARDQIETTCLDSPARTYEAGMATPGTATFTINFDPSDASHIRLHELYQAGTTVNWAMGLSDGTAAPTGVDSAGEFILPTTRTFILFDGFVTDYPFDLALNTVVTSNLGIQISGYPTPVPKTT